MKIECQLSRLETVLTDIRKMHPNRGQALPTVGETLVEEVRRQLEMTPFSDLKPLAYRFSIREILACVEILVTGGAKKVAKKANQILILRPKKKALYRAWFKLKSVYPHPSLDKTLREMISKRGFQGLSEMKNVSPLLETWLSYKRLDEGIIKDHQERDGKRSLDVYLKDNHIDLEDGLHRAAWVMLLTRGPAEFVARERAEKIMDVYEDPLNATHLSEFGQHYLNALKKRPNWKAPILEWIERKFGTPKLEAEKKSIETPFWRQVGDVPKREFAIWAMEKQIEEFFEGERADFWKAFLKVGNVIRVQEILNGDGFMIDFGRFGVIEFKQTGNAAYVYPKPVFNDYWQRARSYYQPWLFKEKSNTIQSRAFPSWDGRIIHNKNWQKNTSQIIKELLSLT